MLNIVLLRSSIYSFLVGVLLEVLRTSTAVALAVRTTTTCWLRAAPPPGKNS